MTGADAWRIVADIFTFGWVPGWVWWALPVCMFLSAVVCLIVGQVIRNRDRQVPTDD